MKRKGDIAVAPLDVAVAVVAALAESCTSCHRRISRRIHHSSRRICHSRSSMQSSVTVRCCCCLHSLKPLLLVVDTIDLVDHQIWVKCEMRGGLRFTLSGSFQFLSSSVTNVGLDGEFVVVKVNGKTGWVPMTRKWGQNWKCNVNLIWQPLSFVVTTISRRTPTSYNVAPANWQFGQMYEGKHFEHGKLLKTSNMCNFYEICLNNTSSQIYLYDQDWRA
ncbi:hypothetical protein Ddye_017772 [Dipteronia dyeriana]|uniref:Expansin n=1 Tax=Dipteronia dyeriana TaxID=168575 RepID=A0AAD9X198_9ROSI|nr:hypothetical protein Ddye_017772 [Dipteronia dyeriana]